MKERQFLPNNLVKWDCVKTVLCIQFSSITQLYPTLWPPWTAARKASLSITNSWSLLKLISIQSVMPSNHLIPCEKVKVKISCVRLYNLWNSRGQNTGVGSLSFLQGIFPTQGSNPGLPHCRRFLYQMSHKGSLRILEWLAYVFSSGSSRPRNWTGVSCIAGGFFTKWAIREALFIKSEINNGHLPFV